ncbi:MAG TPA: DNA polymerase III subunit beta [Armatimonadota bacterium]|nr:DNA polymerase III subunit beta [Armatimonadota bacterium]
MKFTCPKRVFHEALQSVSRAIATRSTLPILGNVLLEARDGQLKLVTTDLEIGMTCILPMEGGEDGAVTIPERILQDVVGNLPDAELTITADERNLLTVSAAKSQYTIHGLPADEFPILPQVPSDTVLSIPGPVLRDLVRKTLLAASTDESRVILTGCLLTWDGETATMVATDTHRLAVKRVPVTGQFSQPVAVIIPARALQELLRLLSGTEDPVDVVVGESQVLFSVGRVRLVSRLIEGQFPAFERVVPRDTPKHMVANRQQLYEAVRRASIVARAESNKVILRSEDSVLTISAETGEVGKAYEEVPISLEGDQVEIAFNAEYLQDVFAVLDTETVEIALSGPLNPGLVTANGEADYQYVVMPMQML